MMNTALKESDWIEEENFLADHWEEMLINDASTPVAGIWKDGLYICLYTDGSQTQPAGC